MVKFTTSNFELDLSNYSFTVNEDNSWFSDRFFVKYTFPFTFKVTDDLNVVLSDILSYNSEGSQTYIEGFFYMHGEENAAILEIQEIQGRDLKAVIKFGFDELPNYDKKLSELPLDSFELVSPETIFTHAESVINQTWPAVSHNFVMVHTDKFDTDTDQWQAFQGLLNKRSGGVFITNDYDQGQDLQNNRNIMQPQPYQLHVLQRGIENAGFELTGDILADSQFSKALFSEISDYYSSVSADQEVLQLNTDEFFETVDQYKKRYYKNVFLEAGRYRVSGNVNIRRLHGNNFVSLRLFNQEVWYGQWTTFISYVYSEYFFNVDIIIETPQDSGAHLEILSEQLHYQDINGDIIFDAPIADLTITKMAGFGANGTLEPTLIVPSDIRLDKCVPDMTFGEYITVLKNWKNLDVFPKDGKIYFNYIATQLNLDNALDLSETEVMLPLREPRSGEAYLLKFEDVESDDYTFEQMYIDTNGAVSSGFTASSDVKEIPIKGIPLPVTTKNGVETADHFIDNKSVVKTILYDGTTATINKAENASALLIPNIYDENYEFWLSIRINGQYFEWSFRTPEEVARFINIRRKVYGYTNYHLIKSINKTLIKPGYWEITLETVTLK